MHNNENETKEVSPKSENIVEDKSTSSTLDRISTTEKLKPFFIKMLAVFIVIASSIAFYFFLLRFSSFMGFLGKVLNILMPIIYGFILAYLLNPLMMFFERGISWLLRKIKFIKNENTIAKWSRGLGILFALLAAISIISLIIAMIIPEFVANISTLVEEMPDKIDSFTKWYDKVLEKHELLDKISGTIVDKGTAVVKDWISTDVSSKVKTWSLQLGTGVLGFVGFLTDFLIGIVVSIYVLIDKNNAAARGKKLLYTFFKPKKANYIIDTARQSHKIFNGFVVGKLIDTFFVWIICFICLSILRFDYVWVISVIIAITNIIPFFGPFIGGIPCTILLLLSEPLQAVYFVVFCVILQQIEGNIIAPMILSSTQGISEFWVMVSLLIGGGFFGIAGMILGTPICAVLFLIIKQQINLNLKHRKLPTDSSVYLNKDKLMTTGNSPGEYEITDLVPEPKERNLKLWRSSKKKKK